MKDHYKFAHIDVVYVEANQNPNPTIPFLLNSNPGVPWTNLDDGKDMLNSDNNGYWYHYVITAYQPQESADNDSNGEGILQGATINSGLRSFMSAIFMESIREKVSFALGQPDFGDIYQKRTDVVVAHEIGHVPGQKGNDPNHAEGGLMGEDPFGEFTPESILRFRKTPFWGARW